MICAHTTLLYVDTYRPSLHLKPLLTYVWPRFAGTDEEGAAASAFSQQVVKREHLVDACGDAARTLKSYQLVGINFLMMLHKSESVGESLC